MAAQLQLHVVQQHAAVDAANAAEAQRRVDELQKQLELLRTDAIASQPDEVLSLEVQRLVRESAQFRQKVSMCTCAHAFPPSCMHRYAMGVGT